MKTHCKRGHELVDPNIYWYNGVRQCKKCKTLRARETRRSNQEKLNEIKGKPTKILNEETKALSGEGFVIIIWSKS